VNKKLLLHRFLLHYYNIYKYLIYIYIYIYILYLFRFVFAQRTYQVPIIQLQYLYYTGILHALMDFLLLLLIIIIMEIKINRTIVLYEVLMK
jgi:hypothetical protein